MEMEARKYFELGERLNNSSVIAGHPWDDMVMYRGYNPDEKIIRVQSTDGDPYMDVMYRVNTEDSEVAWGVISEAWETWWNDGSDDCFGDAITSALDEAGLWYEEEYPDPETIEEYLNEQGMELADKHDPEYERTNREVENAVRGWFGLEPKDE